MLREKSVANTKQAVDIAPPSRLRRLFIEMWETRWCYIFMIPALVTTAMFTLYPSFESWRLSFYDWAGFASDPFYIGLENYKEVVNDEFFWNAFTNSFLFIFVSVPIKLTIGLFLAIILNDRALRLAPIFRTMFYLPVITTTAIVGIVMTFIFSPFNGPTNRILLDLSIVERPIDFLGDPSSALITVALVEAWKWMGNPMIYWLAALQTVPQELYEAARVDGANWRQQFRFITFPIILPFAVVITLIVSINTLNVFALVQTMTGGGPFFASEVMEVYIYRTAFGASNSVTLPRLGYASAAAVFFGIAVMVITVLQAIVSRRVSRVRGG